MKNDVDSKRVLISFIQRFSCNFMIYFCICLVLKVLIIFYLKKVPAISRTLS